MGSIEDKAIDYFKVRNETVALSLFGSQVGGKTRQDSDVDLAVLFLPGHVPDPMKLIEMREDLAETLRHDVDLVCLNSASPIVGFQVLNKGKLLFVKNRREYDRYVIDLLTDYADLKRLRRPIEAAILERKYYG